MSVAGARFDRCFLTYLTRGERALGSHRRTSGTTLDHRPMNRTQMMAHHTPMAIDSPARYPSNITEKCWTFPFFLFSIDVQFDWERAIGRTTQRELPRQVSATCQDIHCAPPTPVHFGPSSIWAKESRNRIASHHAEECVCVGKNMPAMDSTGRLSKS